MKVARKVQKTKLKKKVARFDPFTRGMVWGMHLALRGSASTARGACL